MNRREITFKEGIEGRFCKKNGNAFFLCPGVFEALQENK